jgi:multidrug efflux pump subunit AcrA (membrane-fusion protein)
MNFRKVSIVIAIVILVGAIFTSRFISSQKKVQTPSPPQKSIRSVRSQVVKNTTINAPITFTGKLIAPDKVEIFAEVGGILQNTQPRFKEGNVFGQGAVLAQIDSEEARLTLQAQKSNLQNIITQMMPDLKLDYPQDFELWQKYLNEFSASKPLSAFPEPSGEKAHYFLISKNIYNQYYSIKSQETRLRKHNIIAPFQGVVTQSSINPGTLVRVGQKLGEFINNTNFELEASVSLKDLEFLRVGDLVELYSEDISGQWQGRIKRISKSIDPQSQSVKVYVQIGDQRLREGMFMNGKIKANQIDNAFAIARDLLLGESEVYTIDQNRLKKQSVQVIRFAGNQVIIKGLKEGTVLADESSQEFYEGLEIKTN